EGRQWTRVALVVEALEEEELVLDNRATDPFAGVGRLEGKGIERGPRGLRADVRLVAVPGVERTSELVGSASGDRVDVGADEVALLHIVRRDADLHLLDGL